MTSKAIFVVALTAFAATVGLSGTFKLLAKINGTSSDGLSKCYFKELGFARRLRCDGQFEDLHFDLHRNVFFAEPVDAAKLRLHNPNRS